MEGFLYVFWCVLFWSPPCFFFQLTVYVGKRDFVDHLSHVDPVGKWYTHIHPQPSMWLCLEVSTTFPYLQVLAPKSGSGSYKCRHLFKTISYFKNTFLGYCQLNLKQTSFIFIISFIIQNFHSFSPTSLKLGHSWRLSIVFQATFSPAMLSSSSWETPTCSQVRRTCNHFSKSWAYPRTCTQMDVPEKPLRRVLCQITIQWAVTRHETWHEMFALSPAPGKQDTTTAPD